jgi:hypothetical protein
LGLAFVGVAFIWARDKRTVFQVGPLAEFFEVSCYGALGGRVELLIIN